MECLLAGLCVEGAQQKTAASDADIDPLIRGTRSAEKIEVGFTEGELTYQQNSFGRDCINRAGHGDMRGEASSEDRKQRALQRGMAPQPPGNIAEPASELFPASTDPVIGQVPQKDESRRVSAVRYLKPLASADNRHNFGQDSRLFDPLDHVLAGIAPCEQGPVRGESLDAMADKDGSVKIDDDVSDCEVIGRADLDQVPFEDCGEHAPRDHPHRSALQDREPVLIGQVGRSEPPVAWSDDEGVDHGRSHCSLVRAANKSQHDASQQDTGPK